MPAGTLPAPVKAADPLAVAAESVEEYMSAALLMVLRGGY